jgi:hypothetical protein
MLDAAGVTNKVKELHEANNAKKTEVCLSSMNASLSAEVTQVGCYQNPERPKGGGRANRGTVEGTLLHSSGNSGD